MGGQIKNIVLDLYSSIDDMTLFNFDRYLATQDLNWFRKDYTGRETKIDSPELVKVKDEILDEYFTAIDDKTLSIKMQKWYKISELTKAYNVINSMIQVMWEGFSDTDEEQELRIKYIMTLNKGYGNIRFNMPLLNSPSEDREELEKIHHKIQSIKTKIVLLENELKEDGQKERQSLHKQLRIVANALGQKEVSNPKTITVAQWVADCQLCAEIAKQN